MDDIYDFHENPIDVNEFPEEGPTLKWSDSMETINDGEIQSSVVQKTCFEILSPSYIELSPAVVRVNEVILSHSPKKSMSTPMGLRNDRNFHIKDTFSPIHCTNTMIHSQNHHVNLSIDKFSIGKDIPKINFDDSQSRKNLDEKVNLQSISCNNDTFQSFCGQSQMLNIFTSATGRSVGVSQAALDTVKEKFSASISSVRSIVPTWSMNRPHSHVLHKPNDSKIKEISELTDNLHCNLTQKNISDCSPDDTNCSPNCSPTIYNPKREKNLEKSFLSSCNQNFLEKLDFSPISKIPSQKVLDVNRNEDIAKSTEYSFQLIENLADESSNSYSTKNLADESSNSYSTKNLIETRDVLEKDSQNDFHHSDKDLSFTSSEKPPDPVLAPTKFIPTLFSTAGGMNCKVKSGSLLRADGMLNRFDKDLAVQSKARSYFQKTSLSLSQVEEPNPHAILTCPEHGICKNFASNPVITKPPKTKSSQVKAKNSSPSERIKGRNFVWSTKRRLIHENSTPIHKNVSFESKLSSHLRFDLDSNIYSKKSNSSYRWAETEEKQINFKSSNLGIFSRMKQDQNRDNLTYLNDNLVASCSDRYLHLYSLGVDDETIQIHLSQDTSSFYVNFSENAFIFVAGEKYVPLIDGILLPVDKSTNNARAEQFIQTFKTISSIDCHAVSDDWIKNNLHFTILSLARAEFIAPETFAGRALVPFCIIQLMIYRYDQEIILGKRSIVRRLTEGDWSPRRRAILKVSKILSYSSSSSLPKIELTDGWYPVIAILDTHLEEILKKNGFGIGSKLIFSNAFLINPERKFGNPLEVYSKIQLKLTVNCTRLCKSTSEGVIKLGECRNPLPFSLPFNSLFCGDVVGAVDVVIVKIYPRKFVTSDNENINDLSSFVEKTRDLVDSSLSDFAIKASDISGNDKSRDKINVSTDKSFISRISSLLCIRVFDLKLKKNQVPMDCMINLWNLSESTEDKIKLHQSLRIYNLKVSALPRGDNPMSSCDFELSSTSGSVVKLLKKSSSSPENSIFTKKFLNIFGKTPVIISHQQLSSVISDMASEMKSSLSSTTECYKPSNIMIELDIVGVIIQKCFMKFQKSVTRYFLIILQNTSHPKWIPLLPSANHEKAGFFDKICGNFVLMKNLMMSINLNTLYRTLKWSPVDNAELQFEKFSEFSMTRITAYSKFDTKFLTKGRNPASENDESLLILQRMNSDKIEMNNFIAEASENIDLAYSVS